MVSIIEKNYYNRTKDELLVEIKQNPYAFSYFPQKWRGDRDIVMEAIHRLPHNYYYISNELKKDRIVGLTVILANGMLFCSFSDELKRDKEIAMIAVDSHPFNVKYISKELQQDEDLFFLIVQKNYWGISFFSNEILEKEHVVDKAIEINKNIFPYLNSCLLLQKDFLIKMIQKYNIPLKNIPVLMKNDKDVVKASIQKDYKNYIQIPETLYKNSDFIFQLFLWNNGIKIFLYHTRHERVIDKFHFLLLIKKKNQEEEYNIFHTFDLCYSIMQFL